MTSQFADITSSLNCFRNMTLEEDETEKEVQVIQKQNDCILLFENVYLVLV